MTQKSLINGNSWEALHVMIILGLILMLLNYNVLITYIVAEGIISYNLIGSFYLAFYFIVYKLL